MAVIKFSSAFFESATARFIATVINVREANSFIPTNHEATIAIDAIAEIKKKQFTIFHIFQEAEIARIAETTLFSLWRRRF